MNLSTAQKIRLGAFVGTGIALLVGSILILAGLKLWEQKDIYRVYLKENVTGLEPSSSVRYRGLRIGRVGAMRVAYDNPEAIEVELELQHGVPLYEGTLAMLDMSGLTGLKSVNLIPGDPRAPLLAPGSTLESGPSTVNKLTDHAIAIAERLESIATQVSNLANEENRERLESLLVNLDTFVSTISVFMDETREPMGHALRGFAEIAQEGSGVLRAVRTPLERIDPNALADVLASSKSAMGSLDAHLSEGEMGTALTSLGRALTNVNRLLEDFDLVIRSGREDLTVSMKYLRQAAEDVREFSRIIAQDPSVLIRGREMGQ